MNKFLLSVTASLVATIIWLVFPLPGLAPLPSEPVSPKIECNAHVCNIGSMNDGNQAVEQQG